MIFWDPGGGFGDSEESTEYFSDKGKNGTQLVIKRHYDLVLTEPENLARFIDYRWQASSDVMVEIFEWNLAADLATKLYKKFILGANNNHHEGQFSSDSVALMCSVAISDYLQLFMADRINLPASYFFPHNLSRQLYTQSPDRVFIFRRGQKPIQYKFPPE